jgi:hypothetical protein
MYLGFAEKVICEEREQGTLNREQFQLSGYPQFPRSDKEKCKCFETPLSQNLPLFCSKNPRNPY